MWVFGFIFLIPLTILFLVISGGCLMYFLMGVRQLVTGYKEKNVSKKGGGIWAVSISSVVFAAAIYFYWMLLSSW